MSTDRIQFASAGAVPPRAEFRRISRLACDLERENAALIAALKEIAIGLADTGSTPGQYMTRITKPRAHDIAATVLSEWGHELS